MKVPMGPPPPRNPNPSSQPDLPPPPPPPPEPVIPAAPPPSDEPSSVAVPAEKPLTESGTEKIEESHTESGTEKEEKSYTESGTEQQEEPNSTESGTDNLGKPSIESGTDNLGEPSIESYTEKQEEVKTEAKSEVKSSVRAQVPYVIPDWSEAPAQHFSFEVLKHGSIIEQLDVSKKGAYMFGRTDLCDFVLEHITISRFHAVLQFKGSGEVFLYDLGSTHGTFVNKNQIKKNEYAEIHVGDVIKFGMSSRLYIFQGPTDLMPPEGDLNKIRDAKAAKQEMQDRKESLARAKREASLAEGISWGIDEDAIEDSTEDDTDEITWQNYRGQLTERQEKTKGKVMKRLEKITHMKKEIDSIRAKDIGQGGLTQGQQTQIARNEQRMTELLEELENLEETLNDSIRESLGARSGNISKNSKKKGAFEEEDDVMSDEDDFYDRTKKRKAKQIAEQKSVETAETLLDKKDLLINEIENKNKLLESEKIKLISNGENKMEDGNGDDDLDAFMTGLSSQLVHDKIAQIEKEITDLQEELEKTKYLLKIADPTGEALKKRENLKSKLSTLNPFQEPKLPSNTIPQFKEPKNASINPNPFKEPKLQKDPKISSDATNPIKEPQKPDVKQENTDSNTKPKEKEKTKKKEKPFIPSKPQWLGANKPNTDLDADDVAPRNAASSSEEQTDDFVDYKDRKTALNSNSNQSESRNEIEEAKPGLLIRKRKEPDQNLNSTDLKEERIECESSVADAVALLLKHERGLRDDDLDEEIKGNEGTKVKKGKKEKRVLGPSKPDFMEKSGDYETWVPPEGQTGDGRTSLNERFGY